MVAAEINKALAIAVRQSVAERTGKREATMSNESLQETAQEDIAARLSADSLLAGTVTVFAQRRGITENDILTALSTFNQKGGKVGSVVIVLMPEVQKEAQTAPGPRYFVRFAVQVIDFPTMRGFRAAPDFPPSNWRSGSAK